MQFPFLRGITSLCLWKFWIYQTIRAIAIISVIVIWVRHVVGLSEFYLQKICKSISLSSPTLWPKKGFCILVASNWISWIKSWLKFNQFFPLLDGTLPVKRELKYVHRFLRYFGNRQTNKKTKDKQEQAKTVYPTLRQSGDKYGDDTLT